MQKLYYYLCLPLLFYASEITCISKKKYCCLLNKLKTITNIDRSILDILNDPSTTCDVNVIHISQADIPYTITRPGRYCVIENLAVAPGQDAITIDLDAVTLGIIVLDLNNYSINGLSGGMPAANNGIIATTSTVPPSGQFAPVGIEILNGKIVGMIEHGIYVPVGVAVFSVNDITVQSAGFDASTGGIVAGNADNLLLNPVITNCKVFGGSGGNGIVLINPVDYLILNTTMGLNGVDGLVIQSPLGIGSGVIDTCIASQNSSNGFNITSDAHHSIFLDCVASDNGASGFLIAAPFTSLNNCRAETNNTNGFLISAASNLLTQCSTTDNIANGYHITGNSNVLSDCFAISNRGDGYLVDGGNNNQIKGNDATSNAGTGFNLDSGTGDLFYSNFANNNITANYSGTITNVVTSPTVATTPINFTVNISN